MQGMKEPHIALRKPEAYQANGTNLEHKKGPQTISNAIGSKSGAYCPIGPLSGIIENWSSCSH